MDSRSISKCVYLLYYSVIMWLSYGNIFFNELWGRAWMKHPLGLSFLTCKWLSKLAYLTRAPAELKSADTSRQRPTCANREHDNLERQTEIVAEGDQTANKQANKRFLLSARIPQLAYNVFSVGLTLKTTQKLLLIHNVAVWIIMGIDCIPM